MTSKAENTFLAGVHKHLREGVYAEKMANPYRGGTPDCFYEARLMLWVEYKYVVLPKREDTIVKVELSELQRDWLQRNHDNGHLPWVIVGTHIGRTPMGVVFNHPVHWRDGVPAGDFARFAQTQKEIAARISNYVLP